MATATIDANAEGPSSKPKPLQPNSVARSTINGMTYPQTIEAMPMDGLRRATTTLSPAWYSVAYGVRTSMTLSEPLSPHIPLAWHPAQAPILVTRAITLSPSIRSTMASCRILLMLYALSDLERMISAAITPGIQPHNVRTKTMSNEPQPLSTTAKGGNSIARIARANDMSPISYEVYS